MDRNEHIRRTADVSAFGDKVRDARLMVCKERQRMMIRCVDL